MRSIRKAHGGDAKEWRVPVELEIIFGLQDVVKNPKAAAQAGLAVSRWIPGETEARRPIVFVGKIHAMRCALVAGKHEPGGSVWKHGGLQSGNNQKGAPLGVILGAVVF